MNRRPDWGSRVEFGRVKRKVLSNRTVRPPTQSGQATVIDSATSFDPTGTTTHTVAVPSGGSIGDLMLMHLVSSGAEWDTYPAGWTAIVDNVLWGSSVGYHSVLKRIKDGTETGSITLGLVGGATNSSAHCVWVTHGDGIDFTVFTPDAGTPTKVTTTSQIDLPAVTPSHGAAQYLVFPCVGRNGGNAVLDTEVPPSGYTSFLEAAAGGTATDAGLWVGRRRVDITTAEDPGILDFVSVWTNRRIGAVTIAVYAQSDPDVAAGNHNHVHDDLTGREDAAVNHGSGSATDGHVLTADGAGGAAWEAQSGGGVTDHGALTGLADDDHTQYLLAAGTRAATFLEVSGLTGATASSPRFVGGTLSGAPASGTFALGDYVVTEDGNIFVCTTAGTPGTWTAVGAGAATDADAIHDNVAGEIATITEKTTPVSADLIIIEDSAASNAKKRVQIGNLPSGGGGGGSGNITESVDTPPGTPNAMDDEFDDASFDTGLWTQLNNSGPHFTLTESQGGLAIASTANTDQARGIFQSTPGGTWTVRCKMMPPVRGHANFTYCGLFAGQSTTQEIRWMGWFGNAMRGFTHTAPGNAAGSWGTAVTLNMPVPAYVEMQWDGTDLFARFSFSGLTGDWLTVTSGTLGYTPAIVGLMFNSRVSGGTSVAYDWFRRIA